MNNIEHLAEAVAEWSDVALGARVSRLQRLITRQRPHAREAEDPRLERGRAYRDRILAEDYLALREVFRCHHVPDGWCFYLMYSFFHVIYSIHFNLFGDLQKSTTLVLVV